MNSLSSGTVLSVEFVRGTPPARVSLLLTHDGHPRSAKCKCTPSELFSEGSPRPSSPADTGGGALMLYRAMHRGEIGERFDVRLFDATSEYVRARDVAMGKLAVSRSISRRINFSGTARCPARYPRRRGLQVSRRQNSRIPTLSSPPPPPSPPPLSNRGLMNGLGFTRISRDIGDDAC